MLIWSQHNCNWIIPALHVIAGEESLSQFPHWSFPLSACIRSEILFIAHAFRFQESLTHLEKMGEVVVLGGDAGGVHLVNMGTGDLLASPKMEDHDGPVTGLSAHMTLKHFISCGSDGMIKASL